jgi:antitoxin YefM
MAFFTRIFFRFYLQKMMSSKTKDYGSMNPPMEYIKNPSYSSSQIPFKLPYSFYSFLCVTYFRSQLVTKATIPITTISLFLNIRNGKNGNLNILVIIYLTPQLPAPKVERVLRLDAATRHAQKARSSWCPVDCFVKAHLLVLYGNPVHMVIYMNIVSVNQFRDNLKAFVEQAISTHTPIKVTRRAGEAFVVMSADDWEREQETLYVLQNSSLMKQIVESTETHTQLKGYKPTKEQMDEISRI